VKDPWAGGKTVNNQSINPTVVVQKLPARGHKTEKNKEMALVTVNYIGCIPRIVKGR
jgi:hypothetical protein